MKTHTSNFKNNIKKFGRELDSKITYTLNDETIELGNTQLNSITPHFEGDILKSVMRQLDIDSNVEVPENTILTYQFGVKVGNTYEYINFGNYIVYKVEKQEDTESYKITCYDKMLYSMIKYHNMNLSYPISVRDYIQAICNELGLIFKNRNGEFANYNRQIPNELYLDSDNNSLGYTFRDVLDELAQVTASTICINENDDELEVRYINDTNDTIDEEFLKNVNVNFGEKYGKVNSIVLSRAGGSDNVYLRDEESVIENGLCEVIISDNQIMNFNDRSDYLPDILEVLDGLEYYINDFESFGIGYYNLCDRYNIKIGDNTYSCIMFNDDFQITQGLNETIHTDLPVISETDYTKADKTDRRINQTYIIVDKQNQQIEALAEKIVDVSSIISGIGSIQYENAYKGTLHQLSIKGQISLLFPQSETHYGTTLVPSNNLTPNNNIVPSSPVPYSNEILYPSSDLFLKSSILLVDDMEYTLDFDFLNYINNEICDEFIYEDGKCKIIRRIGVDNEGNKYQLDNEIIELRKDIEIKINKNSIIKLKSFDNVIFSSEYLLDNEYTNTFVPSVDLISRINLTPGNATIEARKIKLEGYTTINENFGVDLEGNMFARNGSFSGNIYLENGNKILGGDGLLSLLKFESAGYSGVTNWGATGFEMATDQWVYRYLGWQNLNNVLDYYIPNNFTITEAYLILNSTPLAAPIDQNTNVVGVARKLKLYSVDGIGNDELSYYWGGNMYIRRSGNVSGLEVTNAFGEETYTPNISNIGQVEQTISKNIAEYLKKGKQASLSLVTTETKPPFVLNEYDAPTIETIKECCEKTGATKMQLYVYGYMKMEGE